MSCVKAMYHHHHHHQTYNPYTHPYFAAAAAASTSGYQPQQQGVDVLLKSVGDDRNSVKNEYKGEEESSDMQQQQQQQPQQDSQTRDVSRPSSSGHEPYPHHQSGPSSGSTEEDSKPPVSDSMREAAAVTTAVQTQFMSANCVVYTYHSHDTGAVVDEHFSRALNDAKHSRTPMSSTATPSLPSTSVECHEDKGDGRRVPMSQRSFPPSFWDSNYQPPSHLHSSQPAAALGASSGTTGASSEYAAAAAAAAYATEFYHHAAQHPLHPLHQTDPWNLSLSSQAYGHHHRPIHELGYAAGISGTPSTGRFNAAAAAASQYGFFMHHQGTGSSSARTASGRTAVVPTGGAPANSASSTGSRVTAFSTSTSGTHGLPGVGGDTPFSSHPFGSFPGFESASMGDHPAGAGKDLYWFQ